MNRLARDGAQLGGGNVTIGERRSLPHKAVQVWRIHVVKTKLTNRIETLLIGDDENDVRTFVGHVED